MGALPVPREAMDVPLELRVPVISQRLDAMARGTAGDGRHWRARWRLADERGGLRLTLRAAESSA